MKTYDAVVSVIAVSVLAISAEYHRSLVKERNATILDLYAQMAALRARADDVRFERKIAKLDVQIAEENAKRLATERDAARTKAKETPSAPPPAAE